MKIQARVSILLTLAMFLFSANAFAQGAKYRLQPSDVLNITVHGQPDLTTKTRVSSDGFISFPLLGKVKTAGLTAQELEENLKSALEKDYLVSAQVLVFIEEYHPRQVSVVGEVKKPGKFDMPLEKDMTLMEAIAMAEGFTKDAYIKTIKIVRSEDGKEKTIIVDARDITVKGQKDKDIVLQPDDVVVVPESFF